MINRIVKLTFKTEYCDDFIEFTNNIKDDIKASEGCNSLEILRDNKDKNIFFTYSSWESEMHLNKYRNSELFKYVWPQTKKWFADKPEAWTTIAINN